MKRSLRSWLWSVPLEQEIDEEIALHLELRTRELIGRGMDPVAAREAARRRLGDLDQLKRTCLDISRKREREMHLTQWIDERRDDIRFAVRQLKRSPGFTLIAAATLALGIGANSAIFSLADAVLIRPLPFNEPDRLVMLYEAPPRFARNRVSPLNFLDWSEQSQAFSAMAAVISAGRTVTGADGGAQQIPAQSVTARFFDVFGVPPMAGRTFVADDSTATPNAVVISERFWTTHLARDPNVVGRSIRLDEQPFTVLGIVPANFQILDNADLWTLLSPGRSPDQRAPRFLQVVGRLRPDVTLEAARAEMSVLAERIAQVSPATNEGWGVTVEPLRDAVIGPELRTTSMVLGGVVGFVLLMACANIASLLLTRATSRARELAVRAAIGAGRRRIVMQLLTESLVLATLGGLIGMGLCAVILRVAPAWLPSGLLPASITLDFDGRVAAFGVMATALVGLMFGLVPAWHATEVPLAAAIATEGRGTTMRDGMLQKLLVTGEVAAAVLVLCGAGLLLRTLVALENVDAGYRANNVLTAQVALPANRYPAPEQRLRFFEAVEAEVANIPGIRRVGWGTALPLEGRQYSQVFDIVGAPMREGSTPRVAGYQIVSASYFSTLDVPMVSGRGFTAADTPSSMPVCIVDQEFVRRHLEGREPIGTLVTMRQMNLGAPQFVTREIVGVVQQIRERPVEFADPVHIYVPITQNPWFGGTLVVETGEQPAQAAAAAVRAAVARVDPARALTRVRTLDEVAFEATSRPRFRAAMVVVFAVLALVLATIGIFGVLAASVQRRTREFGIRMALGATESEVLRMVVGYAGRLTAGGVAIGLVLAAVLSQSFETLLFGIPSWDPVTFGVVPLLLAITAIVACVSPALRAVRVDPSVAFRGD